tara:strand:- start:1162 stop:1398 length:237 start_codon:yes stop_codon:yes gene_type:complete
MSDDTTKLTEQDAAETFVARQIVQEIMDYGVTQFQIGKVIELLALELENRDLMVRIRDAVSDNTANDTTGIILDGQEV